MRSLSVIGWLVSIGGLAFPHAVSAQEATQQQLFEKVFGPLARFDPAIHKEVASSTPGQRHWIDTDRDGKPQEVWFIDTDSRHPEEFRPVLVKAIDEDGDLREDDEPDLDSDLYVADWKADGTVDAILDYTDTDGDNDVDEMGMYFFDKNGARYEEPLLRVWWGRDVGDDNLLWYDVGYHYDQTLCQLRSHFGGDETFVAFALGKDWEEWEPFWENPFSFYDHDGDGVAEEVFRNSGIGTAVEHLRHSFDADNDATWDSPRDYDVSVTAHAPEDLHFDERYAERIVLRGIQTGPFLTHAAGREFPGHVVWGPTLLTWDENDNNVDGDRYQDKEERWEGVIAKGNPDFKQVGGPSGGEFNKRNELDLEPEGPMEFYYHPTDQRIHLKGADKAWILVDVDNDRVADARYDFEDTNGDGYIDTWKLDADADGEIDDTWENFDAPIQTVGWSWAEFHGIQSRLLLTIPDQLFTLNERLGKAVYLATGKPPQDRMTELFGKSFRGSNYSIQDLNKLISSRESLRYFFDLHRDLLIDQLKQAYDSPPFWTAFENLRLEGNYPAMILMLDTNFRMKDSGRTFENWRGMREEFLAPNRVAWAEDWVPPNIGWESEKIAYRAYWGQFDFFGKKAPVAIYPTIGKQSYHDETEWGMDALLVGNTGGCGGVTLYVNGEAYPVRSPEGKGPIQFEKKLIGISKEELTIEMTAQGAGPTDASYTIRYHCKAISGRQDSPIEILIEGGKPGDEIELGVGLIELPHENVVLDTKKGILGSWGWQTTDIGTIGMGIVFPPDRFVRFADLPDENQVVLSAKVGQPLTYHIHCDWLRGRRFNRCPTSENWRWDLERTAAIAGLR